jgi:hypothetical protein
VLVEVATVCDNDPSLKRELLEEARRLSREEPLNRRIADDLTRLDLLGRPLVLQFESVQGAPFSIADERGKIVILVFWSAESAPSLLWIEEFRHALDKFPAARMVTATVSVDTAPALVRDSLKEARVADWPTACDGKGWNGPLVRACGINALPTVFVIDQSGILRAINARNSYESWIRKLIIQPGKD